MAIHVKNADLREQIILSKEQDKLTDEAVRMIILMAEKLSHKFRYQYEQDREDCRSTAIMDVLLYWKSYSPEKGANAFSYFSQILFNGFYKGSKKCWPVKSSLKTSINRNNIYSI